MKKSTLLTFFLLLLIAILLRLVYAWQIEGLYSYMGYKSLSAGPISSALLVLKLIVISLAIPRVISKPSDFFCLFYSVVVLLSSAVFSGITGYLDALESVFLFLILLAPLLFLKILTRVKLPVLRHGPISDGTIYLFAVCFLLGAAISGLTSGISGGFDWATMYERRHGGRELIAQGSFRAYLLAMAINGIAPFLGYVGGLRGRPLLFFVGLSFSLFSFWLLGMKAPFLMVAIFSVMGVMVRRRNLFRFPYFVLSSVAVLLTLSLIENSIWNGVFLSETLVRRAFAVQAALQEYFLDAIFEYIFSDAGQLLLGLNDSISGSITFYIGEKYVGSDALNANTNAFLYALSGGGMIGYVLAIVFVGVFFSVLDRVYIRLGKAEVMFVSALYALLLCEQAYTTSLLSSGIGLLLVLVLLMKESGGQQLK